MADAYTAIQASMLNDASKLRVLGHNLANGTTVGFKKQIAVNRSFIDYLKVNQTDDKGNTQVMLTNITLPAVRVDTDISMGTLNYTDRALDVASEGTGFFTVLTPNGVAYTKQGNFNLDSTGLLVNSLGYPVIGQSGEIRLTTDQPRIDLEGNIWDGDKKIEQFKIVEFHEEIGLTSIGSGLYVPEGYQVEGKIIDGRIRQGYLEVSNVILMEEMVKMIDVMRHFESSQRIMQGYDGMLDNAINIVGDL